MRRRALLGLVAMLALLVPASALAKVKVVATLPSLAAIAAEVGRDDVEVVALASPRQDPHYVDPRPSLIVQLARADVLVVNGLALEESWLAPVLLQSRNGRIARGSSGYFDASLAVEKRDVPSGPIDRAMGDIHPGGNPHFLFDPRQGARIALALAERLAQLDDEHAAQYRARAAALSDRLSKLAERERARFLTLDENKRRLVSYHKSLTYLFAWLGLEEVATIEPRPGIPPDPAHVASVLSTMKARGVRVIALEEFYPAKVPETLARLSGGEVVTLPGGARFDDGQSYSDHIAELAEALHAAMSR